jgi:hypothetical protein
MCEILYQITNRFIEKILYFIKFVNVVSGIGSIGTWYLITKKMFARKLIIYLFNKDCWQPMATSSFPKDKSLLMVYAIAEIL